MQGDFFCENCGEEIEDGLEYWDADGVAFCSKKCRSNYRKDYDY